MPKRQIDHLEQTKKTLDHLPTVGGFHRLVKLALCQTLAPVWPGYEVRTDEDDHSHRVILMGWTRWQGIGPFKKACAHCTGPVFTPAW